MDERAGQHEPEKTRRPRRVDPLMMMTVGLGVFFLAVLALLAIGG
ncbi:MAG TPA: hypothetical protein VNQ32_04715 [Steroidobacteraceae bacterium]|nr:hypothetical protein [Steroidobacteraceae bacterium]